MDVLKHGLQIAAALVLLAGIGFLVWYLMFHMASPDIGAGGTLVQHTFEQAGKLVAA